VPEPVPPALTALADTLVAGTPAGPAGPGFPSASARGVDRDVAELVASLPRAQRADFGRLLGAIESPLLNLLLGGSLQRFTSRDRAGREEYLRGMARSRLALKRRGFQAAKRLVAWSYFSSAAGETNPLWPEIRYAPRDRIAGLGTDVVPPNVLRPESAQEVSADVCVIGSGAGGSVVADALSAAGYRVVILEAGEYVPAPEYPSTEREGFDRFYVGRGLLSTRDTAIALLAGAGAGGGTSINWMTCLAPRPEARAEWAAAAGVGGPNDATFDAALAAVRERLSVSTAESAVFPPNEVLRRGSVALGYRAPDDWEILERNAVGCDGRCGFCGFGCTYGARRSTVPTYLASAFAHGARLYAQTRAELIEIEGGRARGVRARCQGPGRSVAVNVRAPTVVVAAGALQTPPLLWSSGVRHEGVGIGLRLDPTTALAAEFPTAIRTWEGPPQTVAVRKFQTAEPGAHGPWIESSPAHPGLSALAVPWSSSADFLRLLRRLEHVATPIVLVRDTGEGRVRPDEDGRPVVDYRLRPADRAHLVRGLEETARIMVAAGATRLLSLHTPAVEVGGEDRPLGANDLDRFVAGVGSAGIREHSIALFSAHAMGSARAGRDPRRSAALPSGRVHGIEGLWIADGSLLPSAPGANPMLSILAWAHRTGEHLVAELAGRPAG